MTYLMSWETKRIDPLEFIQEQNNKFEEDNSDEFEFDFLDVDNFDAEEIL